MNKWTYTPNPDTLVDRLNGIYPSAVGQYAPSPINKEAAAEILRLRSAWDKPVAYRWYETKWDDWSYDVGPNEYRASEPLYLSPLKEKPAEAG